MKVHEKAHSCCSVWTLWARKKLVFGTLGIVTVFLCSSLWLFNRVCPFSVQHGTVHWARQYLGLPHDGFYSQHGQDRWVHDYLSRQEAALSKVFVEFGANNGLTHSNTAYFEKVLGFRGVCMEPNLKNFEQLRRNRPGCICVHAAIGNCVEGSSRSIVEFSQDVVDPKTGKQVDYSGLNGFSAGYRNADANCRSFGCTHTVVPCNSLQNVLDTAGISRIDYMTVDTEGSELEALRTMDWEKMHGGPVVVQIELGRIVVNNMRTQPDENEVAVLDFMHNKGYVSAVEFTAPGKIAQFGEGQKVLKTWDLIFVRRQG